MGERTLFSLRQPPSASVSPPGHAGLGDGCTAITLAYPEQVAS